MYGAIDFELTSLDTGAYAIRIMIYKYLDEQQQISMQNNEDNSIENLNEFIEKCGPYIFTLTTLDIFFEVPPYAGVISSIQCYHSHNKAREVSITEEITSLIAGFTVGYITFYSMNFDLTSDIGKIIALRQGLSVVSSIVITHHVTTLLLPYAEEIIDGVSEFCNDLMGGWLYYE